MLSVLSSSHHSVLDQRWPKGGGGAPGFSVAQSMFSTRVSATRAGDTASTDVQTTDSEYRKREGTALNIRAPGVQTAKSPLLCQHITTR